MTMLNNGIQDSAGKKTSTYAKQTEDKVPKKVSAAAAKQFQLTSLRQGLTEAILISRGEMEGTPLSKLWDE